MASPFRAFRAREAGPHFGTEAPEVGFSQALTRARTAPGKSGHHFRTKYARARPTREGGSKVWGFQSDTDLLAFFC